jgi:hypothetical protein
MLCTLLSWHVAYPLIIWPILDLQNVLCECEPLISKFHITAMFPDIKTWNILDIRFVVMTIIYTHTTSHLPLNGFIVTACNWQLNMNVNIAPRYVLQHTIPELQASACNITPTQHPFICDLLVLVITHLGKWVQTLVGTTFRQNSWITFHLF